MPSALMPHQSMLLNLLLTPLLAALVGLAAQDVPAALGVATLTEGTLRNDDACHGATDAEDPSCNLGLLQQKQSGATGAVGKLTRVPPRFGHEVALGIIGRASRLLSPLAESLSEFIEQQHTARRLAQGESHSLLEIDHTRSRASSSPSLLVTGSAHGARGNDGFCRFHDVVAVANYIGSISQKLNQTVTTDFVSLQSVTHNFTKFAPNAAEAVVLKEMMSGVSTKFAPTAAEADVLKEMVLGASNQSADMLKTLQNLNLTDNSKAPSLEFKFDKDQMKSLEHLSPEDLQNLIAGISSAPENEAIDGRAISLLSCGFVTNMFGGISEIALGSCIKGMTDLDSATSQCIAGLVADSGPKCAEQCLGMMNSGLYDPECVACMPSNMARYISCVGSLAGASMFCTDCMASFADRLAQRCYHTVDTSGFRSCTAEEFENFSDCAGDAVVGKAIRKMSISAWANGSTYE